MKIQPTEWDPMEIARYLDGNLNDEALDRIEEQFAHDRDMLQLLVDYRSRPAAQAESPLSVRLSLLAACLIAAFGASYAMGAAVAEMEHQRESVEARFRLI